MTFEHLSLLEQMVAEGFISVQTHPSEPLRIYNYTPRAQYGRIWNEATTQARGLILGNGGEIVQRPFRKFFNIEEMETLPAEPFEVTEKMDGSLGILYKSTKRPHLPMLATRGAFTSEQAQRGSVILHSKYKKTFDSLRGDVTYLFEIIYPGNRIVVDYGDTEDLILLAVIDDATGRDLPLPDIGFPRVKRYDGISDVRTLKPMFRENAEGFVVRFESGLRVKVKFEEYVRLHRLITQCSSKSIWECLSEGRPLDELLERVPDEFFAWVRATATGLTSQYSEIEEVCRGDFKELPTRKETALYFQTCRYPKVLFAMLDKREHSPIIWKHIRPQFTKPFKTEI